MASFLDLFRSASGQPDINQQIATALGQAPGQPGSPQGPQPGPGAPAAPPAAGAPPAGPQGPPQAPQQPEAYQSQPDMAQLYFKFAQQQHADDMFNRGIAGIAAGFAPSWDRNAILGMGRDTSMDAGSTFGNLVKIQGWQQQQQQYKAWLDSVPDLAGQLGMTKQEVMALGPESTRTALGLKIPPEQLRNYNAFKQQYVAEHAGDPGPDGHPIGAGGAAQQFEQQNPMSVMMAGMTGAGVDPNEMQRRTELAQKLAANPGKTAADFPQFADVPSFLAHKQLIQQQSADRGEAVKKFGDLNAGLGDYVDTLGSAAADPNLPGLVGNPVHQGLPTAVTLGEAYPLHTKLQGLQGKAADLAAKAGPGTQASLLGLNTSSADLTKYALPENDYRSSVIQPMMRQALTAQANNYGASGQTDRMPGYLRPYLSDVYKPGGELYVSGGGVKKAAPNPKLKQLTPSDISDAQANIEKFGPKSVISHLKDNNYDTSPLE